MTGLNEEQQKQKDTIDELADFQPKRVEEMNRSERRSRLQFFTKMLKKHLKSKPKIKMDLSDEESREQTFKLRNWMIRFEILNKKVNELNK